MGPGHRHPVGDPLTGHNGPVNAVAVAELDGRPMVISGSDDETVRVWDLATGTPGGEPFTGRGGPVNAVTCQTRAGLMCTGSPIYVGVGAANIVAVSAISYEGDWNLRREQIAALEVKSNILALSLTSDRIMTVATELGIVVFDLPSASRHPSFREARNLD